MIAYIVLLSSMLVAALPSAAFEVPFTGAKMSPSVVAAAPADTLRVAPADSVEWLDPVAKLQRRLDSGDAVLVHDSLLGYLPSLLQLLEIPVSSQGLVFSRTSLQTDLIAPWAPRALYFNDDVYIGYVLGSSFLEVAAVHPTKGAVFYTVSQEEQPTHVFEREGHTCLMCHDSRTATGGVPGFMVLSTLSDRLGYPIGAVKEGPVSDATPYERRWGGWYVTGTHGNSTTNASGHSGNVYSPKLVHEVTDRRSYIQGFDFARESSLTDLSIVLDTTKYLSRHSDIVALSVLVHQTDVHNLITALHEAAAKLPADAGDPESMAGRPDMVRVEAAARRVADGMLFAKAAPLEGTMTGSTRFAEEFSARGPKDAKGRSLRDFDLKTRMFRYPLSFLIYSEAFTALPKVARALVYTRIAAVLDGSLPDVAESAHLTDADRVAIREIVTATLPDFAALTSR